MLKVRAEEDISIFTEENKQENKTTGAETNYLRPKEVAYGKKERLYSEDGERQKGLA